MSRKLALIIGSTEYDDKTLSRLVTPSEDAADLARVLNDDTIGGFDEVVTLLNQPAQVVRQAIARFFARKKRTDLLLLYFSGHGVLDDQGRLYLAARDTEHDLLSATGIPAGFITDEMDASQSRRQVLILDCCHSGAFARGAKNALGVNVRTPAVFEGNGTGRVVLTATNATQYAWEGNEIIGNAENSVFTHFLVKGLETGEADANQDGYVTLEELYDYVYDQMVEHAGGDRRQTPGKWSYRQHGEIYVARNPHRPAQAPALPDDVRSVLGSSQDWVRRAMVLELARLLESGNEQVVPAAVAALKQLALDVSPTVAVVAGEKLAAFNRRQEEEKQGSLNPPPPSLPRRRLSTPKRPPTQPERPYFGWLADFCAPLVPVAFSMWAMFTLTLMLRLGLNLILPAGERPRRQLARATVPVERR